MNKEQWVDIKNYEGLYQISNFGRIKSFHKSEKILKPRFKWKISKYLSL